MTLFKVLAIDVILFCIRINKTNEGKTCKSEKKRHPLVPRYFGMCRIDTNKIRVR
jgi:hypothetical protein